MLAEPVPVVSTLTAAALPKGIVQPPPAVARVPWLKKVPANQAVDVVAVGEIERNTNSPSMRHGMLLKLAVTVCAGDAPSEVPPVVKPMIGVMTSVPVAGVVIKPPIANLKTCPADGAAAPTPIGKYRLAWLAVKRAVKTVVGEIDAATTSGSTCCALKY